MESTKQNTNTKLDWNALDTCWAEQYEEDYGYLLYNKILNNHRTSIPASNIEACLVISA